MWNPTLSRSGAALVLGPLLLVACSPKGAAQQAPDAGPAPFFSDAFRFECAEDRDVGCAGVFPVREPSGDRPVQLAVLDAGDALRSRLELIERATTSIRIQALIFRGDDVGLTISDALKRRKQQGVDVRVIVDALSNLDRRTQWMYFDLKQHGVEVEGYETLYLNWIAADWSVKDPLRGNKRFHEKLWVVDAEVPERAEAIIGGMNIANEYFRIAKEPLARWRDQDVALRGRVVDDVAASFDRNYEYLKGLKERLPAIFDPDNSWKLTRAVLDEVAHLRTPKWRDAALTAQIELLVKEPSRRVFAPVRARFLQSRPRVRETYITQTYLHWIESAKRSIDIWNAYFVPSRQMVAALNAAAERGVRVRILTNSPESNDVTPVATLSRHVYWSLLARDDGSARPNIEVHEWIGPGKDEGTLHAKHAVFDDDVALVGSYNLDPRSDRLNSESAVAVQSAEIVARLRSELEAHDLAKTRRVSLEEARSYRSPPELAERFELLFSLPLKGWL
ncbi:MAG: phosphatidylserine/phosphatidylglycerophosphate/cardiolipin synthase family protein [Deltaproteobacteria bacterium]|nr:phosphatidylserine/phosphatidylglycerophosphate/cardiolipin synthase family protein [Deltaproteobacteria bacterium]